MNVTCPNCATIYRVDPAKVPEGGVRTRCSVCSAVFAVRRETEGSRAATKEPPRPEIKPVESARPAPPRAEPPRIEAPPPAPAKVEPPRPEPIKTEPVRPAATAPPVPMRPPVQPPPAAAGPPAAGAPPAAPAAPRPAAPPRPANPGVAPAMPAPPAAPRPAAPAAARPAAPLGGPAAASPSASVPPPAASPATPRAAPGARPANPFLSQDPALKARRLARALISDMVVYHPSKRQDGLRDGNLKDLFQEEIKKSWEEYAEQVGREVAESTPYFREALNEILAGGRQIF